MLSANEAKPVHERLTLIRIFEALRELGYEGGYDAVRRYARVWQRDRAATSSGAFIPLSFAQGEAYQFDRSHEVVLINGTTVTVKMAHVRLRHSRMLFVRAYPRETQEMVFDAHDRAFAFFKGMCSRGVETVRTRLGLGPVEAAGFQINQPATYSDVTERARHFGPAPAPHGSDDPGAYFTATLAGAAARMLYLGLAYSVR
jgi:hypothetical protein